MESLLNLAASAAARRLREEDARYFAAIPVHLRDRVLLLLPPTISATDVKAARDLSTKLAKTVPARDIAAILRDIGSERFHPDLLSEVSQMRLEHFDSRFHKATDKKRDILVLLLILHVRSPDVLQSDESPAELRRALREHLFSWTRPPPVIRKDLRVLLKRASLSDEMNENLDKLVQAAVQNDDSVFEEFQRSREGRVESTKALCKVFQLTPPKSASPKQRAFAVSRFLHDWCREGLSLEEARESAFITTPQGFGQGKWITNCLCH